MTFGSELLDKQSEIEEFGSLGNEAVSRLADYFKKRAALSEEYARGLQKLQRQFSPVLSYEVGMEDLLGMTDSLVGAHFLLSEQVNCSLLEGMRVTAREHDKARREVLSSIRTVRSEWKKTLGALEKGRKARDTATRAAEDARTLFDKANNDKNVTKAYVEKVREDYVSKARKTLLCKEEYIQAARNIRHLQRKHYDEDLAGLFDQLQKIEEQRLVKIKRHLAEFGELIMNAVGEEMSGLKKMTSKWDRFVPASLIDSLIDDLRSDGLFLYPEDIDNYDSISVDSFGLLESPCSIGSKVGSRSNPTLSRRPSKANASAVAHNHAGSQAVLTQLEVLKKERSGLERHRDGIKNLTDLYSRQPELADAQTKAEAAKQLSELLDKLESLCAEQEALETRLAATQLPDDDAASIHSTQTLTSPTVPNALSSVLWEDDPEPISPITEQITSPCPGAPGSGLTAITFSQLSEKFHQMRTQHRATAVFDFDPLDSDRELGLKAGDIITILSDEGEWWHAQTDDGRSGYVPFNYVRSHE